MLLSLLQLSISFQHGQDGSLLLLGQETQVNHGDRLSRCLPLLYVLGLAEEHDHHFARFLLKPLEGLVLVFQVR